MHRGDQGSSSLRRWGRRSVVVCCVVALTGCEGSVDEPLRYLEQEPPGMTPEVFAPGALSLPDRHEFGSVFSKDGTELYFGVDTGGRSEIWGRGIENRGWSEARIVVSHEVYGANDPMLSPNETELFFISNRPRSGTGEPADHDLWFLTRAEDGWGPPRNAGPVVNSEREEYYASFTDDGTLYFASNRAAEEGRDFNFDLYSSRRVNGVFQAPRRLGDAVNSRGYEGDVFVAPDESYLIFTAARREGLGKGDLYISFRTENGGWTEAENMGPPVNTEGHELCPFVSRDGRYFFYTSDQDIRWVDAAILDGYR